MVDHHEPFSFGNFQRILVRYFNLFHNLSNNNKEIKCLRCDRWYMIKFTHRLLINITMIMMITLMVCPDIHAAHLPIWTIFNKNTITCEWTSIEIDSWGNIQDNTIQTLPYNYFTRKKSQEREQISYGDL